MLDEAKAKAFYLDYLGFEVDWEGRFNPTAPLYMQIHLGEAVIHLNGHAQEDAPISQVNIPVVGLDKYCQYLIAKGAGYPKPCVVDPRFLGRNTDMNIDDPFGNIGNAVRTAGRHNGRAEERDRHHRAGGPRRGGTCEGKAAKSQACARYLLEKGTPHTALLAAAAQVNF